MKIAIPVSEGKLFPHFGHCPAFALIDVDEKKKSITGQTEVPAPPHEPGLLPPWLAKKGVNLIMAGGIGARACDLFMQNDITVISGVPAATPEALVLAYLNGTLKAGVNSCDH
jgi:predicted Fe-Mo cluster-binding NifX family protein